MSAKTEQKLGTTELLFYSARQMGLNPHWVALDGLFSLSVADLEHYYINFWAQMLSANSSMLAFTEPRKAAPRIV